MEKVDPPADLPAGWSKHDSSAGPHYYANSAVQCSMWRRPIDQNTATAGKRKRNGNKPKVAIIVPFRDLDAAQKRSQHLDVFIPSMTRYLDASDAAYGIYIVEQSNDEQKFNRGKLLNVGFKLAEQDGCEVFIFHDVDLIPSTELLSWYTTIPFQPAHIARVWNRYSGNPSYFGGVVSFSKSQYESINGFPNNFWGWGGEDDEMYKRVKVLKYKPIFPEEGEGRCYIDLECNTLEDKLAFLKGKSDLKCMNKRELLSEDEHNKWKENGLSDLEYKVVSKTVGVKSTNAFKITVAI